MSQRTIDAWRSEEKMLFLRVGRVIRFDEEAVRALALPSSSAQWWWELFAPLLKSRSLSTLFQKKEPTRCGGIAEFGLCAIIYGCWF